MLFVDAATEVPRFLLRLTRRAALAFVTALLAGCFASQEPLISADAADYPFESLTYLRAGSDEENTLVRVEGGYRPPDETDSPDRLLLKDMGNGYFVVQVTMGNSGGSSGRLGYLYGLVRVSPDRTSFVMTASEAEDPDLAAVESGYPGLAICANDPDTVCVEDLEGYAAFGRQAENRLGTFTIVRIK